MFAYHDQTDNYYWPVGIKYITIVGPTEEQAKSDTKTN